MLMMMMMMFLLPRLIIWRGRKQWDSNVWLITEKWFEGSWGLEVTYNCITILCYCCIVIDNIVVMVNNLDVWVPHELRHIRRSLHWIVEIDEESQNRLHSPLLWSLFASRLQRWQINGLSASLRHYVYCGIFLLCSVFLIGRVCSKRTIKLPISASRQSIS